MHFSFRSSYVFAVLLVGLAAGQATTGNWRSGDGAARNRALTALVVRHSSEVKDALIAAMDDPDTGVRQIAFSNLELLGNDPRVIAALRHHLETESLDTRWMIARTIAMNPAALVTLTPVVKRLARDPDVLIRNAVLANAAPGPGVEQVMKPILLHALSSADQGDQMTAAESLHRLKISLPEDIQAHLIADLGNESTEVAGAASYVLMTLWDDKIDARLRKALRSDSWLQRARVADLFRKRNKPFDVSLLAVVIRQGGEAAALSSCGTLARIQDGAAAAVLKEGLKSVNVNVRQAVVYGLEANGSPDALQALQDALVNPDGNVRYRATVVLGRMQARSALGALNSLASRDPDGRVRDAARLASAVVSRTGLGSVLPQMQEVLEQAKHGPLQRVTLEQGAPTVVRDGVVQIGTQKQLFVDDVTLESQGGAHRVFHKFTKDPRNPIFEQQVPWEYQGVMDYCTTIDYNPDLRLFRLWYISNLQAPGATTARGNIGSSRRSQMLALSTDGIHWVRPNLALHAIEGSRDNNLITTANNIVRLAHPLEGKFWYGSYGPWRETGNYSLAASFSPDGIGNWSPYQPLLATGGDVSTVIRDDIAHGYLGFSKWQASWWLGQSFSDLHEPSRGKLLKTRASGFRAFAPIWGSGPTSFHRGPVAIFPTADDDRVAVRKVAAAFASLDFFDPDTIHSEVYEVTPFLYEGVYFGFPEVFTVSGRGGANSDGVVSLSLTASRDPMTSEKWLRNGGNQYASILNFGRWGEWDSTQIYGPNSILVINDQIVLYYTGIANGHEPAGSHSDGAGRTYYRTAIGRATLRLDGLVSLSGDDREVTITTKPLSFAGNRLLVNVKGKVSVELLDRSGRPIPGFGRADAVPFQGDELRHVATWRAGSDLTRLAATPVRVRFFLRHGDLYSYQFTSR